MRHILTHYVVFLMLWRGVEPRPISVMEDIKNTFSSVMKNQDESLAKDVDAQKQYSSHLDNADGRFADVFDDILSQVSNEPSETSFEEVKPTDLSSLVENMKEDTSQSKGSDFISDSIMNDNNVLVELVDEILKQTSFNNSSEVPPEEATTIGKSITKRDVNEDHVSEAIDTRESSLYLRDVQGSAASTTETAVSRGVRDGNMPCAQLLNFMRHNIVVTAFVVGAILMSLVILLLWFISCIRRRQPLYPPANVTYNIFIMGEKTWWQKNSEKYLSKLCGKAKSLHCNSCI